MKIARIETRHCDAGWRNYHFVKLTTDDGVVGWSEYDQHQGALGVTTVIEQLGEVVVGYRVADLERIYQRLLTRARQSMSGVMAMAIGAIENALLDARAKELGVPCCDLLGGRVRDRVRVYWSHCGTWRIGLPQYYGNAITDIDGVKALADLDLFWIEIDTPSPEGLATVRQESPHPISSCETLITPAAFLPFLRAEAVDVAIIDAVWNGVWQSMKIAALAGAYEVNVAPHNYYGHLATMMNAHMSAAVPNLRIMETDIDRLPWDGEVFTHEPEFEDGGYLVVPDRPGWGTEPDEEGLAAHPPT